MFDNASGDSDDTGEGESEATEIDELAAGVRYVLSLGTEEGLLEAPIDLNIGVASVIELRPLLWYNHEAVPKRIKITNTGHTVILSAKWERERPYLIDGPFLGKYVFSQLHFHWGENEMVGSEHYVDGCCFGNMRVPKGVWLWRSMAMELHAVHFKAEYSSQDEALRHVDGVAILVYLFTLYPTANPILPALLEALPRILNPGEVTRLETKPPLAEFIRPFAGNYLMYWGALKNGDVSNRVLWLISREPIGVTEDQVAQFRNLLNNKGQPILGNCRGLQQRGDRKVFWVNPSPLGSTYATLLKVPSEPPPPTANQTAAAVENLVESVKSSYFNI